MMTVICFMDDIAPSLTETFRVLRSGGVLIIGFIDTKGEIAWRERKSPGRFLRHALFRSVDEVKEAIRSAGFTEITVRQCLHGFCFITSGKE